MSTSYKGIRGGTISGDPLCRTCRQSQYVQGQSLSDCHLYCHAITPTKQLSSEAYECGMYEDKRLPQMYQLEQIAWIFAKDVKTKRIGFKSPEELQKLAQDLAQSDLGHKKTT